MSNKVLKNKYNFHYGLTDVLLATNISLLVSKRCKNAIYLNLQFDEITSG